MAEPVDVTGEQILAGQRAQVALGGGVDQPGEQG